MSRVVIRNVAPEGLHGFRRGQLMLDGLDDALTIVFAPNATGKSTLAKALGLLLTPKGAGDAIISGVVECDGVEDSRAVRRKDEPFPGAPDRPEDYQLDIIRLLGGLDDTEKRSLSQLVGGGLNIAPGSLPVVASAVTKTANEARSNLVRARNQGDATADDENRLPLLRQELARAEAAIKGEAALRAWRQRRDAERRVNELRGEIFALIGEHPGIGDQPAQAVATAKALVSALRTAETAVETARIQLTRSHSEGFVPSRVLTDIDQEFLSATVRELNAAKTNLGNASNEKDRKAAEVEALRKALLRFISEGDLAMLGDASAKDFADLSQAATEADQHRALAATQTGYKRALDEWKRRSPEPVEDPEAAIRAICQWLEAAPVAIEDSRPQILAVLAVAGALLVAFLPSLPIRIGVALVVAIVAGVVQSTKRTRSVLDRRPELAASAGLPANATPTDAANRIAKLDTARAHTEAAQTLQTLAGETLPGFAWQDVAQRLRLISNDPYQLAAVSRAASDYLKAVQDAGGSDSAVANAESSVSVAARKLNDFLDAYGFPHESEAPELAEKPFLEWFVRSESLHRSNVAVREKTAALTEYLDKAGIPEDDNLESRLQTLEEREPMTAKLLALYNELDASEQVLAKSAHDPEIVRGVLGDEPELTTEEQIDEVLHRLAEQASHRDEFFQEKIECEKRISDIEKNAALPEAQDRYAAEMRKVETKWNEYVREAVRYRIKAHLTNRMRTVELPEIIRNANDWVGSFTSGRYRLVLGPAGAASKDGLGVLSVQDSRTGREQRFGELSTGTKVHLVLALRLGLIERHEMQANAGTRRFPLIADEVMAVSDPDASRALAAALAEISASRQVIVFTNQPDDVRVFRELKPDVTVKTLGSIVPEVDDETELPIYVPPVGPRRLDLRLPVWSHDREAILPDHFELTEDCDELFNVLENVRLGLVRDYPRLDWSHISEESWTRGVFREDMRDAAYRSWGDAWRFLSTIKSIKGMRSSTKEEAEVWFSDHGYLVEPPGEKEIRERVKQHSNGSIDPFQQAHIVTLVMTAFQA